MNKLSMGNIKIAIILAMLAVSGAAMAQRSDEPEPGTPVTDPKVIVRGSVYGGGNLASVGGTTTVTINQLGSKVHVDVYGGGALANVGDASSATTVTLTNGVVIGDVYGGGLGDADHSALVNGTVTVTIDGGQVRNVFGCNNVNGAPQRTVEVTVNDGTVTQSVYGGGNVAAYAGSPVVTINGGTVTQSVYGGGNLANVSGSTTVTVNDGTVSEDVYGGGALANVGVNTTVNIMGGTISGDIYGGGLGRKEDTGVTAIAALVGGTATVNIGTGTVSSFTTEVTDLDGNATIGGNVYGCNNANGSPQDDVTVNVFKTAHTTTDMASYTESDATYAIANVFGGGNEADFSVLGKTAYVNIYTCENTIGRVFGGGNAAAAPHVATEIQGGRINKVFGGGNGEVTGANIGAGINLTIHGGNIGEFYGGSNQSGVLNGDINVSVVNDGPCTDMEIDEFFCGGNFVNISGNLETTIACSQNMEVHNLYGGCKMADISGDVVLNVYGGIYTNVYGGSKGDLADLGTGHQTKPANIGGSVTLNLYGGTIENAYGGSNINGNIGGSITVNVLDANGECPLYVTNIYGGSNMTNYTPTSTATPTPVVNVIHAINGISGNVYGGSKGVEGTAVNVNANPLVNIGYEASSMLVYVPKDSSGNPIVPVPSTPRAIIAGSVFGGGDAATVNGNTEIYLRNRAKVFGNVYGGGNMGVVSGNTKVIVNGDNE